jgi:ribonuclease HI
VEDLAENALNIYTDGSSYSSPRVGGTGFLFITVDEHGDPEIHEESPPGWKAASNNQMELQACIEALKIATGRHPPVEPSRYVKIVIRTDSTYVANSFNKALYEWSGNQWRLRGGAPVANTQQWKELVQLVRRAARMNKRVEVKWIKGHKQDPHNRRADTLAKRSAKAASDRTIRPVRLRRKKTPNKVIAGSVRMEGQVTTIRVISDESLPRPHKGYRYMYEVMDEASPYYELGDKATSEIELRAGHTYLGRFNQAQNNPRIKELLAEVEEDEVAEDDQAAAVAETDAGTPQPTANEDR